MARALGRDVMTHLVRGYVPGRSGDIVLIPKPWNVVAQWPGGLPEPSDPRTTHASPWGYVSRTPIVLHGPGYIRSGVISERAVDVTDLPATFAELMGFDFDAPAGRVLRGALLPRARRNGRPRVIVLVVYDGGGWNVLEQWPAAWPVQAQMARAGSMYVNATVGSAPPVTAPVHANMGTGAYPSVHGMAENTGRLPDGTIGEMYFHRADPQLLESETLADEWDRARGNQPWVGLLGYDPWHLGMMGHGAQAEGGDRDVAVLWERERDRFWINEEVYRLPSYLPGPDALDLRLRQLDRRDGALDGRWMGNDLNDPLLVPGTPAFVAYQGDAVLEMVRREPIGLDHLTDLLFVELKPSDNAGHLWNMLAPEMEAVIEAQDAFLGALKELLDERVGPDEYVMTVTADHGQSPHPDVSGGLRIDRFRVPKVINAYFGTEIVEAVHPDDVYLNTEALSALGIGVEDVARLIGDLRYRDLFPEGTDPERVPPQKLDERVFAAALPGAFLEALTMEEIRELGPGEFAEADLTSPTISWSPGARG